MKNQRLIKKWQYTVSLCFFSILSAGAAAQMDGNYMIVNIAKGLQPNIAWRNTDNSLKLMTAGHINTALDFAYGYQTEDIRIEASVLYWKTRLKQSTFGLVTEATDGSTTRVLGLMFNGLYDWNRDNDFTPYLGLGLGQVKISQHINGFVDPIPPPHVNDSSLQFAYQAIAGVSYHLTDSIKASMDYRYLRTLSNDFNVISGPGSTSVNACYSNHRVSLGLTAFF